MANFLNPMCRFLVHGFRLFVGGFASQRKQFIWYSEALV